MTYEEKRNFMRKVDNNVNTRAQKADLYYVICFWMSPIIDAMAHRHAYFDDVSEAYDYQSNMIEKYKNKKYYIASNLISGDIDGGLL